MHTLSQVQSYRSVGILPIIPPGQFNDPLVALRTQILPPQFSPIGFGRRYGTVHRNHVPLLDARRQGGAPRQRTRPPQPPTHTNRHHRNTHQHHQQHTHTPATPPTPTSRRHHSPAPTTSRSRHPTITTNPPQPHRNAPRNNREPGTHTTIPPHKHQKNPHRTPPPAPTHTTDDDNHPTVIGADNDHGLIRITRADYEKYVNRTDIGETP